MERDREREREREGGGGGGGARERGEYKERERERQKNESVKSTMSDSSASETERENCNSLTLPFQYFPGSLNSTSHQHVNLFKSNKSRLSSCFSEQAQRKKFTKEICHSANRIRHKSSKSFINFSPHTEPVSLRATRTLDPEPEFP